MTGEVCRARKHMTYGLYFVFFNLYLFRVVTVLSPSHFSTPLEQLGLGVLLKGSLVEVMTEGQMFPEEEKYVFLM